MPHYEFHLRISPAQYQGYYRGTVRHVVVRCTNGQTVQFPVSWLQQHVSLEGVRGDFTLTCDEHNKVVALERRAASA